MTTINLVFPHQLFEQPILRNQQHPFILTEEYLFFRQYAFHQQKIAYHRAAMKAYADQLRKSGASVRYIEAQQPEGDVRHLIGCLAAEGLGELHYIDPCDDWLEGRLKAACLEHGIRINRYASPMFLNTEQELGSWFEGRKRLSQTDFYLHERKRRNLLLEGPGQPLGGKWTYDTENRLRYPKGQRPPWVRLPKEDEYTREAASYVRKNFAAHYGEPEGQLRYPHTHEGARAWLDQFLEERFAAFGPYEDAIVAREHILHHGVLTPMLNTGLLTPDDVLDRCLQFAAKRGLPISSLEGFVRQLTGWREFMRGLYLYKGREARTKNFWGFTRKIPGSFYTATTGILPVDLTIRKVLDTAYCHHIERLMVLGNFMLLCEFDPDEVYRWFMELFIDAYDWVMVPNIYSMSQFADGGIMATKPYISGSNYLMKMSDYPKGDWQAVWDALFWRFLDRHRAFFLQNPRLGMLVRTFDKMPAAKRVGLLEGAEKYLQSLDNMRS